MQVTDQGSEGEFLLSNLEPCLCHVLLLGQGKAKLIAWIVLSLSAVDTYFSDWYFLHIMSEAI